MDLNPDLGTFLKYGGFGLHFSCAIFGCEFELFESDKFSKLWPKLLKDNQQHQLDVNLSFLKVLNLANYNQHF